MVQVHPIAKLIVNRGLAGFDDSMFSGPQKEKIYGQAAEIFFRQGKFDSGIVALERAGLPLPIDKIKAEADKKMLLGKYDEAYELLAKVGDERMAEFVRTNFLNQ